MLMKLQAGPNVYTLFNSITRKHILALASKFGIGALEYSGRHTRGIGAGEIEPGDKFITEARPVDALRRFDCPASGVIKKHTSARSGKPAREAV